MDSVSKNKLDSFFSQHKRQNYKKGEILIRADDNPSGIFYLTEGLVKMYCISDKGDEIILNIFKPISFFPMSWAINNTQNVYFYEALTDVYIWRAPKEAVTTFITENPDVLLDLMSRVYKGVDGMLQRMTYLMAGNAYTRLAVEIIIAAKRLGKHTSSTLTIHISEKDLAAQSGMTRETVSREMAVLKRKRLVSFNKKVLKVLDLDRLTDELSDNF